MPLDLWNEFIERLSVTSSIDSVSEDQMIPFVYRRKSTSTLKPDWEKVSGYDHGSLPMKNLYKFTRGNLWHIVTVQRFLFKRERGNFLYSIIKGWRSKDFKEEKRGHGLLMTVMKESLSRPFKELSTTTFSEISEIV